MVFPPAGSKHSASGQSHLDSLKLFSMFPVKINVHPEIYTNNFITGYKAVQVSIGSAQIQLVSTVK